MCTSERARSIQPSPTLGISAKAGQMRDEGINIIDFGAGEPDFNTPDSVKAAGIKAIEDNFTGYTPASGTAELKTAVKAKLYRDEQLNYDLSEITVGCGAKHVLFNLMATLLNPGDEILVPVPYWVSYPEQIRFFGGKMRTVDTTDNDFMPTAENLAARLTPNCKILLLNSPANPTGVVYSQQLLEELGQFCLENNLLIISDEIYEKLTYEGKHLSPAQISDEIKKITVIVNGVSKAYSMTGWRIGYAAGPRTIISKINSLMSHSTSNPCSISQKAATRALQLEDEEIRPIISEFNERRQLIVEGLNRIPGVSCESPGGAFYAFPNCQQLIDQVSSINSDMELAEKLLEDTHVAVVPGSAFGTPGYLRLSYATDRQTISDGLEKISEWARQKLD